MREMKDSGVEWIGEIPKDWETVKSKYMFSVVNGATPRSDEPDNWEGNIVWVTPTDMKQPLEILTTSEKNITHTGLGSCGTTIVPPESIVLSTRAPIGKIAIAGVDLCTNQGCKVLVAKKDLSSRLIGYYLFSISDFLVTLGRGTTFIELSTYVLLNLRLPYPTKTQQDKALAYLDAKCAQIDRAIARQQEVIEKLKEYKLSVVTEAVTKGLNPDVTMNDSGIECIGEIPEHWDSYRIAALYREVFEEGNDDLPILSVSINTGVSDRELEDEEQDRIFVRSDDKSKYKRVRIGDLTYNMMRAWQGAFGAVRVEGMVSPAYVVARPHKKEELDSRYIEYLLRTPAAKEEMRRNSHGIADFRLRLYWAYFKSMKICFPSKLEQEAIADYIDEKSAQIDSSIARKDGLIDKLTEYKKSLIYEVVTGKREV